MLNSLLQYDTQLFLYLNNLGTPVWDGFWMFYTTKYNWIPLYALLIYFMFKKLERKQFILILLLVAFMITFTDQVTNLFKHGLERLRPCHNEEVMDLMRLVKSSCGGKYGFFSGHASNSMSIAFFTGFILKRNFKYIFPLLFIWAFFMAYSRIYIGVHYPLDVLCGMCFGALSGFGFYHLFKYLNKRLLHLTF